MQDVRITIHGAISEKITISNGQGVTTDSTGKASATIKKGTWKFTGGVSGKSFERTVGENTTDIYVMPEGAIYWYGNQIKALETLVGGTNGVVRFDTNNIYISSVGNSYRPHEWVSTVEKVNTTGYSVLKAECNIKQIPSNNFGCVLGLTGDKTLSDSTANMFITHRYGTTTGLQVVTLDKSNVSWTGEYYVRCGNHYYTPFEGTLSGIWLE